MRARTVAVLVILGVGAAGIFLSSRKPPMPFSVNDPALKAYPRPASLESPRRKVIFELRSFRIETPPIAPDYLTSLRILREEPHACGVVVAKDDYHFRNPEWEIDGQKVNLLVAPANDRGLVVPYVFGTRELAARLRPNPEADWIDVRLPPNGVKLPDIPNKEISFGTVKVRFEVEPVLTPVGVIRVRVRVLGGQSGERFAVSVSNNQRSLVCGPEDGILHLRNWLRKTPFTVRVESLRATQIKLTARVQSGPSGRRVDLDGPDGSLVHARFGKNGEFVEAPTLHDERSILELKDRYSSTFGRELSTDLWVPQGAARSQGMACMRAATHGQVLEATHYKLGPAMTANIELDLPDPNLFVRSRYSSGHGGFYYSPPSRWFPARKD